MPNIKPAKTTTAARKRSIAALTSHAIFQIVFVNDKLSTFGESLLDYLWSFKDTILPGTDVSNMWEWWRDAAEAENIKVRRPSYIFGALKFMRREVRERGEYGGTIDKPAAITVAFKFFEALDDAGMLLPAVQEVLLAEPSLGFSEAVTVPVPERQTSRRQTRPAAAVQSIIMVGGVPHHVAMVAGQMVVGDPVNPPPKRRTAAKKTASKKPAAKKGRRLNK